MTDLGQTPIPQRLRAECYFCGRFLNIEAEGVYQLTMGWVKNRAAGGGNAVALPEREDKWAHGGCVDLVTSGMFSQDDLFGGVKRA